MMLSLIGGLLALAAAAVGVMFLVALRRQWTSVDRWLAGSVGLAVVLIVLNLVERDWLMVAAWMFNLGVDLVSARFRVLTRRREAKAARLAADRKLDLIVAGLPAADREWLRKQSAYAWDALDGRRG